MDECEKIRNLSRQDLLEQILEALDKKERVRRQWIFSSERWREIGETLQQGARTHDFSALRDGNLSPACNMLEITIYTKMNAFHS